MVKFEFVAEHLIYHLCVFWAMFAVYRAIGFDNRNFTFVNNRSNHEDNDLLTTLWYAVSTHVHMGATDILPTSALSRTFTGLHLIVTFVLLAGVMLIRPNPVVPSV